MTAFNTIHYMCGLDILNELKTTVEIELKQKYFTM